MVRLNYGSSRILFFLPAVMKLVSQKRSPRCNELPVSCHYNPVREIRPAEKYFILWSVSTNQFKSSKTETPGRGKGKRRSSSREVLKLYLICFTRTVVAKEKKKKINHICPTFLRFLSSLRPYYTPNFGQLYFSDNQKNKYICLSLSLSKKLTSEKSGSISWLSWISPIFCQYINNPVIHLLGEKMNQSRQYNKRRQGWNQTGFALCLWS